MAASDKNIVISPQRGSTTLSPTIAFTGDGNDPVTLYVPDGTVGSLSFEGSAGQLFSITNNLTSGSIFSVNDVSGIPSLDIDASGLVQIAPLGGEVALGQTTVTTGNVLDVKGNVRIDGDLSVTGTNLITNLNADLLDGQDGSYYLNTSATTQTKSGGLNVSGNVGIGTTNPANTLHVYGTARFNNSSNNLVISTYSGDPFVFVEQNAPLIIGTNSTERLRIDGSGNVGIGTTDPQTKLHVYGSANGVAHSNSQNQWIKTNLNTGSNYARFDMNGGGVAIGNGVTENPYHYLISYGTGHASTPEFAMKNNAGPLRFYTGADPSNSAPRLSILTNGNVGIGTTNPTDKLYVSGGATIVGNLGVSGDINSSSDIKLKTNIKTLTNSLEKVLSLRGVEYDRIDMDNKHQIGVIAQEVEEIVPELVSENNGIKSVSYGNITALLIEAIKEQQKQIEALCQEISDLRSGLK